MKPFDVLQSFIETCEHEEHTVSSITVTFCKAIQDLGFRNFACVSHVDPIEPPSHAISVHNYPAGWVERYCESKFHRIDPVLLLAERNPLPFLWDTTLRAQPLTDPQKEMLAEAASFGLEHGYTVPIHLSWTLGALRASCSVVPDTRSIDPMGYLAVDILTTHLYVVLRRIQAPETRTMRIQLTPRQLECLALAAQGKGDRKIGQLLSLSQNTVHSHIGRAMRRLGVTTRVQAIMKALESRQISQSTATS